MSGEMVFCRACGGQLNSSAPACPHCGAPQRFSGGGDGIPRSFGTSIGLCFAKYATFAGRAPRAEFWWFALFVTLVQVGLSIASAQSQVAVYLYGLFSLVIFLPYLSVFVRRLHDRDRSGWWYWLFLIPIVGAVILLVWLCSRGTYGPNRFGAENGAVD